jgi:hypothetical protein
LSKTIFPPECESARSDYFSSDFDFRSDQSDHYQEEDVKPTKDQIEFAGRMTKRQADTLHALAIAGPFFLSATERADTELFALIKVQLARVVFEQIGSVEFISWEATP